MEKQNLIILPSHNQCLALMAAHGMLPNIREHSFRVMEVASFLGQALAEAGFDLHLPLVTAGALLHDLGKALDQDSEGTHPALGADLAAKSGEHEIVVALDRAGGRGWGIYVSFEHPEGNPVYPRSRA